MIKILSLSGLVGAIIAFTISPYLILISHGTVNREIQKPLESVASEGRMQEEYVCKAPKKLMRKTYAR